MKFELADTSPEMMDVWIALAKQRPPSHRVAQVFEMIGFGKGVTIAGPKGSNRGNAAQQLAIREFGTDWGKVASEKSISQMHHAFAALVAELANQRVRFAVCGSLAIAACGFPRTAHDIDFLVDIEPGQVERLAAALGDEFVAADSTLIHVPSVQNFDLHRVGANRFRATAIERSRPLEVDLFGSSVTFPVVSAEDAIVAKLVRFNNEEWQRDAVSAFAVHGDKLDRAYMSATAAELGLTAELNQLFD